MIYPFEFEEQPIKGLYVVQAFRNEDVRGDFTKDYSREVFLQHGINHELAEVFYTRSKRGVVRGLHFQREKQQAKLVRCIEGHVWDVCVDLRKDSPTFKQWMGFDLKGSSRTEVLIPEGCAHGYLVIEDSIVSYKCGEKFYGEYDDGIVWDDQDLGILWPLDLIKDTQITLSDKDKNLQSFTEFISKYRGFA